MSKTHFSFHFRKEFLSNLPNIFIFAIGVKWVNGYAIYAACEKQDEKKLEGYNIVGTPGELIGKGGGLWSRHNIKKRPQMKNHLRPFFIIIALKLGC